jgi:hypothetical protein
LHASAAAVIALAFANGELLVASGGAVQAWGLEDGELRDVVWLGASVTKLVVSNDERYVAVAATPFVVRWKLASHPSTVALAGLVDLTDATLDPRTHALHAPR